MNLHEAIQAVLKENNRPMTAKNIAFAINARGYYHRNDNEPIQSTQIYARIKNYPSIFQNINGHIVLIEDEIWKNLLTSYEYLVNTLRGIFILADIQFIIAILFYYKRLIDLDHESHSRYLLEKTEKRPSFHDLGFDRPLIEELQLLERNHMAPEGVFDECTRLLSKLEKHKTNEIWRIIDQIDTRKLNKEEFGSIYEYFLTIISIDSNKTSLNHTPFSLRQLMVEILNPQSEQSLYDPVAGIGGLLVEAILYSKSQKIYAEGSEINKRIAQLGNLNLYMHGIDNVTIQSENCFEQVASYAGYDYIIGDLPANGITNSKENEILYHQYNISAPKSGKSFGSLVLLALSKLKADGKAVLAVSDGFLVKKGKEKEIRDLLVKQDVVECIVSLPYGTLRPYTDAKASLLVLNKNKTTSLKNCIQFITAQAIDQGPKSLVLDNDEIIQAYTNPEKLSKNTQIIPIADLDSDTNLSAGAYDTQFLLANTMLKEGKGRKLHELVEIKAGIGPEKSDFNKQGDIPLIKVENLSKDIVDLNLGIPNSDLVNHSYRYARSIISQECILVARIGDNLKATVFKPTREVPQILPHINVYTLIPNKTLDVNIEYLYYQLHTTFIYEQINKRKLGAVMPYISISGLREVVIPYMSLESQREFVDSQKASLVAEERKRVDEWIRSLGYKEETKQAESDTIKTLTHQLRPTFTGLNSLTQRIVRVVQRENLDSIKEYDNIELNVDSDIRNHIAVPDNFTLAQLLEKLAGDTKHLSDILSNVDKVMNFKLLSEDLKEVDIMLFLMQYERQKEIEQEKNYSINIKGDSVTILLHEASFKELLDQLLINAEKHAFIDKSVQRLYRVQFIIRYDKKREVVSIEYSNNGAPYELTQKDFTTAFEKGNKSSGSGIGGNYIKRIVEAHNGKLLVEENYKKGFLLTIELPSANNKEL